jgi:NAD(P)-dependent dehydrogenase (short-subunit alcohol dehydrogenase family)
MWWVIRCPLPQEVVAAVVYLAGLDAASITGQVLGVDGGLTAQ